MNVAVFGTEHPNPQWLLHEITGKLQHVVLPKVEDELADLIAKTRFSNVVLDRLSIDLTFSPEEDLPMNLATQLAAHLVSACEKQMVEQQLAGGSDFTGSKQEQIWNQIRYFYQWGYFPFLAKHERPISLEKWEKEIENDDLYAEMVKKSAFFIQNDQNALRRFLNQHSISYIRDALSLFFTAVEADFFMALLQFSPDGHNFATTLLLNFFQNGELTLTQGFENAIRQTVKKSRKNHLFLQKMEENGPLLYQKYQKIIENGLSMPEDHHELTGQLKLHCQPELYIFIQYLRSDVHLQEKLDPLLRVFFSNVIEKQGFNNWVVDFVRSIHQADIILNLLMELEELQPLNGDIAKPEYFAPELKSLIRELEKQHDLLPKTEVTKPKLIEQSNVQDPDLQEQIHAARAGVILLNPFLPTLFKNLNLQNEKGEWLSEHTQAAAIYIIHYLASGEVETTEDQLYLAKVLTGFPLQDVLPKWEVVCRHISTANAENQWLTQLNEKEIPQILNTIRENWYPMRNCTWNGLQNDFLNRPGLLELKENKQYKLTIEPHALDVLLPHIKWGISMIKYSWMEEILHVEWA